MHKFFFSYVIAIFLCDFIFPQPKLELYPDEIEFENLFNRIENVYFINEGDSALRVDSIYYNSNYYFVRFDKVWNYPFFIQPGDTVKMDCIISSYFPVQVVDTLDTMYVYNNGEKPYERIKIKIDYYDDNPGEGIINGYITSGAIPIQNAKVHFIYGGNYLIKTVYSDQSGFYSASLPPGPYLVAAEMDSFYVTFYNQQFNPFNANLISLEDDSIRTVNIDLTKETITENSISGIIKDSLNSAPLRKGIVIVRSGTHTPNKIQQNSTAELLQDGIYSTFIKNDGSYEINNILEPAYYFVQSFSDYYIPTYYSASGVSPVFWQQADSIRIDTSLTNKNILMPRDSSTGGGIIGGNVSVNLRLDDNLEDVVILAQSLDFVQLFNYAIVDDGGNYKISNLPFGNYKVIGQKIGYEDAISSNSLNINSVDTIITGVNLTFNTTSIQEVNAVPGKFELYQNYPNPFNPSTTIEFNLSEAANIQLTVTNVLGEEVAVLHEGYLAPGKYKITYNALSLSSGAYFVKLKANDFLTVRKILLLK